MQAARFHGIKDIRVESVSEPGELRPHEVLLRPQWCGICGTDLHEYVAGPIVTPVNPHPLTHAQLPQILGHEFSGDVIAIGSQVSNVQVGNRVAVMPLVYCGQCYYCRRGLNHLCQTMGCIGLSWAWGGLAEQAIVLDYQVASLPDTVTYEQGALIEPAAVAAWGVAQAGVRPGDTVLITGAGPIGGLAILAAVAAGASQIYLSEPNLRRAHRAERLGHTALVDPTTSDVAAEIRERTNGLGVDASIECSGNAAALNTCIAATRKAGRVAQTGLHVRPAAIDAMRLSNNEITLVGTWCYPVYDWPRMIALVASGKLPMEQVISSKIELANILQDGFEPLLDRQGDQMKILVNARSTSQR